ncbi:MAG: hypothetical protein LAN84_16035 [Acidobacteriia bacterium]|nr:hypothetical protein [Terriglobia bacterium]
MRSPGHFYIRLFSVSLLLYFLTSLPLSFAQNPPADAAEISRGLLYLAPAAVQLPPSGAPPIIFSVQGFNYEFTPPSGWKVTPNEWVPEPEGSRESLKKRTFTLGGEEYTLTGSSDDDRAMLALYRAGAAEPLATALLWNREQLVAAWLPLAQKQKKSLTAAALRQELEIADPLLYATELSGDSVWVAVGHSTGESEYGLGTVVRFDVKEGKAAVFQPAEIATCAVTHLLLLAPDSLLLGARRQDEGAIRPCAGPDKSGAGLLRFQPSTAKIEQLALPGTRPGNSVVTLLRGPDPLWVATDSGICKGAPPAASAISWTCWRFVPTIHVEEVLTLTNKPGEERGSDLPPGDYEVLWANAAFFEIATKDSYDAWLAADDFKELSARNFDTEPWKLLNTAEGPGPIRPLAKPGGKALEEGTLVYRAPLEKLPAPQGSPAGYVKVRIRAGWIPRAALEVVPQIVPVALPKP